MKVDGERGEGRGACALSLPNIYVDERSSSSAPPIQTARRPLYRSPETPLNPLPSDTSGGFISALRAHRRLSTGLVTTPSYHTRHLSRLSCAPVVARPREERSGRQRRRRRADALASRLIVVVVARRGREEEGASRDKFPRIYSRAAALGEMLIAVTGARARKYTSPSLVCGSTGEECRDTFARGYRARFFLRETVFLRGESPRPPVHGRAAKQTYLGHVTAGL